MNLCTKHTTLTVQCKVCSNCCNVVNVSVRQLSKIPPNFEGPFRDKVSDGHAFEMRLRDGDLIIAYVGSPYSASSYLLTFHQTDGLCDNVFVSEMLALCTLAGRAGGTDEQQVQAVTDNFVHYARACMINDNRSGPWARERLLLRRLFCPNKHFLSNQNGLLALVCLLRGV